MTSVLIEGYTIDEILELPDEQFKAMVLCDEPIVFKAGTANILGQFRIAGNSLVLELAHVDGGGEGALPAVAALANQYARRKGLEFLEWQVYAVHCAKPNLKLRRVLERRGFVVRTLENASECYWQRVPIQTTSSAPSIPSTPVRSQ